MGQKKVKEEETGKKKKKKVVEEVDEEEEEEKVNVKDKKKKAKKVQAVEEEEPAEEEENKYLGNKTERKPFQRIEDSIEQLPEALKNNSYEHFSQKSGDMYGKPANDKLRNNKGKDFRKEKTKFKNKTSFGGQQLSTDIRCIMFNDDDE